MSWEIREGRWQDSPLESVDHIICDPPYDARTHAGHKLDVRDRDEVSFSALAGDVADVLPWASARRWTIAFCALEQLGAYQAASGDRWVRAGIWVKQGAAPQFSGDRPGQGAEGIAIMHAPGRKRWNGGGKVGVWRWGLARGKERCHETPKPVGLMMNLILDFTDPGDLVWDPYCGSGTTGIACHRLGRRFVGHELNLEVAAVARARLESEDRELDLSDAERGQLSIIDAIGEGTAT